MKNKELKKQATYQPSIKFKRTTQERHCSLRLSLCDKESQLKNLANLDLKKSKRHSVMIGQPNRFQIGIFNFEKEEADEDDSVDNSDIEEEKNNENNKEVNPIDAFKKNKKKKKKKKKQKKKKKRRKKMMKCLNILIH